MDQGLLPRRYAKALYQVAGERDCTKPLYELMQALERAFASEPKLASTLANPFVEVKVKKALVATAAGVDAESAASQLFADFISLLARNKRLDLTRQIALAYVAAYRAANGIYSVAVTSAVPLAPAEQQRIHSLIQKHLPQGATAEYTPAVDPDLIGGFTVAIDNELLDASVANEFKQLRLKLLRN